MPGRACSPLAWSPGQVPYPAAPLRQGRGQGRHQDPSGFSPSRAGRDRQNSAHRQHRPLPSPPFPGYTCSSLSRRTLWSWLCRRGYLIHPRGHQRQEGRLHQWQYLVVVGEFLTGRDTQLHGLHSHLLWHVRVLETGQGDKRRGLSRGLGSGWPLCPRLTARTLGECPGTSRLGRTAGNWGHGLS